MADLKISETPSLGTLDAADLIPVVDSSEGTTKHSLWSTFVTAINALIAAVFTSGDWNQDVIPLVVLAPAFTNDGATRTYTIDTSGTDRPTAVLRAAEYVVRIDLYDGTGDWFTYLGIFELLSGFGGTLSVLSPLQEIVNTLPSGASVALGTPSGSTVGVTLTNNSGDALYNKWMRQSSERIVPWTI